MLMKTFLTTFLLVMLLFMLPAEKVFSATSAGKDAAAIEAAELFVGLIDLGDVDRSWEKASTLFADRFSKDEWSAFVSGARPEFGQVLQRTLKGSQYVTSIPGAPAGEYVLILFISSFEHRDSAVETVTATLDPDGRWRVAGYSFQ